jgi:hypothetical protein
LLLHGQTSKEESELFKKINNAAYSANIQKMWSIMARVSKAISDVHEKRMARVIGWLDKHAMPQSTCMLGVSVPENADFASVANSLTANHYIEFDRSDTALIRSTMTIDNYNELNRLYKILTALASAFNANELDYITRESLCEFNVGKLNNKKHIDSLTVNDYGAKTSKKELISYYKTLENFVFSNFAKLNVIENASSCDKETATSYARAIQFYEKKKPFNTSS